MNIDSLIQDITVKAVKALYDADIAVDLVQVQQTKKEFTGDKTIVVFPFLKVSKKSPEITAAQLGEYLKDNISIIESYNVVKGFLNICISQNYWIQLLNEITHQKQYGFVAVTDTAPVVMVEYSSPNTNKPLHLGHIRNNLLGFSIANILEANGNKVLKVNLVNDRGIHICKSMLAWQKFGNGETPQSTGLKGDHLVGKYYVRFDKEYKVQIAQLVESGKTEDQAKNEAPIIEEAREMLRKWEAGDHDTVTLWTTMNNWVYEGFDVTYKQLGVTFDKIYYESQTYLLGKEKVIEGMKKGVLYQKEDTSIWADLEPDGLDHKLLLRPDGTSVYMTQDIGTAIQRFEECNNMNELIYVVGNEQNYHFQVLALILKKLGYQWADKIYHMSYGMVELPEGKMKSREGTVVDADELMAEMISSAEAISKELGKLSAMPEDEAKKVYEILAMGALKYFILKVEPRKTMTFNPKESIDFNGNTGPFIQYTYTRIHSVLKKASELSIILPDSIHDNLAINDKEIALIKTIALYPEVIKEAGLLHSPAVIANYVYDLVKEYNQFYHDFTILKETNDAVKVFRLVLSKQVASVIKSAMGLLGIEVPNRM
ncbi:MAG: arginine--tRNA ligase [Bacteroidales bacterium]|nr:arginine--tRNA ligase [Bacteroidales bacterium]